MIITETCQHIGIGFPIRKKRTPKIKWYFNNGSKIRRYEFISIHQLMLLSPFWAITQHFMPIIILKKTIKIFHETVLIHTSKHEQKMSYVKNFHYLSVKSLLSRVKCFLVVQNEKKKYRSIVYENKLQTFYFGYIFEISVDIRRLIFSYGKS